MDLYLEFRKMIRPLTIPNGEEEQGKTERQPSRKKRTDDKPAREDGKSETITSMVTCEV